MWNLKTKKGKEKKGGKDENKNGTTVVLQNWNPKQNKSLTVASVEIVWWFGFMVGWIWAMTQAHTGALHSIVGSPVIEFVLRSLVSLFQKFCINMTIDIFLKRRRKTTTTIEGMWHAQVIP